MKKQILEELNRAREIMGLDLLKEDETLDGLGADAPKPDFDPSVTDADLELVEDDEAVEDVEDVEDVSSEEGEFIAGEPVDGFEVEIEYVDKPSGVKGVDEQVISEQKKTYGKNQIVIRKKKIWQAAGQDMNWSDSNKSKTYLEPYIQYKFDKKAQEPLAGTAEIFMDGFNTADRDPAWRNTPLKNWKWGENDNWMISRALGYKAYEDTTKLSMSVSKMMHSKLEQAASEVGVSIPSFSIFRTFYKRDDTKWNMSDSKSTKRKVEQGVGDTDYIGFTAYYPGRDNTERKRTNSYYLGYSKPRKGNKEDGTPKEGRRGYFTIYYPKGKYQQGISQEKLADVAYKNDAWWEICSVAPNGLKKKEAFKTGIIGKNC